MILDFLLTVVAFMLVGISNILPVFTLFPAGVATAISTLSSYVSGWSWLFPTGTLFAALAILILVATAEFAFHSAIYILNFIVKVARG